MTHWPDNRQFITYIRFGKFGNNLETLEPGKGPAIVLTLELELDTSNLTKPDGIDNYYQIK